MDVFHDHYDPPYEDERVPILMIGAWIIGFTAAVVAIAALLSSSHPAGAADLKAKATPVAAPTFTADPWTGAYVGINAGYGWNLGDGVAIGQPATSGQLAASPQGALGGVQAGIGARFSNFLYAGVEGDIDGANITGTAASPGLITGSSKNTWLMSARARLGVIPLGNAMFYGTAGYGWGGGSFSVTDLQNLSASVNPTMSGFVWGGGVDFALTPSWILGFKYLQYDFGTLTVATPNITATLKDRVDVVRAELSYKF